LAVPRGRNHKTNAKELQNDRKTTAQTGDRLIDVCQTTVKPKVRRHSQPTARKRKHSAFVNSVTPAVAKEAKEAKEVKGTAFSLV
jgi:hypothetical protein